MRPNPFRRHFDHPLARICLLLGLCPTIWVVGMWLIDRTPIPHPSDISVAGIVMVASVACLVLALLELAQWAAVAPLRRRARARLGRASLPPDPPA